MAISKEFEREIVELSVVDKLRRGLRYRGCGDLGTPNKYENPQKELRRIVPVMSLGRTGNLDLESDEQMEEYGRHAGKSCRVSGPLARRNRADAVKTPVEMLIVPGSPGWEEPTDAELLAGFVFDGFGKILEKRLSDFQGKTYRTLQLATMGETFRFTDIDPDLFAKLPEDGILAVLGTLESRLSSTQYGKENDMFLVLADVKPIPETQPARTPRPVPPSDPPKAA